MDFPNIFTSDVAEAVISRINKLQPDAQPAWGKMSVSAMLAHCNVTYEMVYEDIHPRPGFFLKLFMKGIVKNVVTGAKPFGRNLKTAPAFLIKDSRDLNVERKRLIGHIRKTQELGEAHFNNKLNHSFGRLNVNQWNNMFYKHLDHHLTQFGV